MQREMWIAVGVVVALSVAVIGVSYFLWSGAGPADTQALPQVTEQHPTKPAKVPRAQAIADGGEWVLEDGTAVAFPNDNSGLEACMRNSCTASREQANLDMCRRRECKLEGGSLSMSTANVTFAGGTFSADVTMKGDLPKYGGRYEADPVLVGVTLSKKDGTVRDLEPVKYAASGMGAPLHFEATGLDDGYTGYVVAAWGKKITPCTQQTQRDGCDRFGYALGDNIGSFPEGAYEGSKTKFQGL
jgi:hypothetical protein